MRPPVPSCERVTTGSGVLATLPRHIDENQRVLIVRHRSVDPAAVPIGATSAPAQFLTVSGEPTIDDVLEHLASITVAPTLIIAVGGGSVIDTAKALAAFLTNDDVPPTEYLEIVGTGRVLDNDPLPVIAVPTTAGAGSEMTHNAVLSIPEHRRKVSLRDPRLRPAQVLLDPDLSHGIPRDTQVSCALDAVVQCVESYATPYATDESDAFAFDGACRGFPAAHSIISGEVRDSQTMTEMALCAAWSGAALSRSKLGTIHGLAGVLGGMVPVPHGVLCGLFAGPVLRATIEQLRMTDQTNPALRRYAALARLTPMPGADPDRLVEWFESQVHRSGLTGTSIAVLDAAERDAAVEATASASSTQGNPAVLSNETLRRILDEVCSV